MRGAFGAELWDRPGQAGARAGKRAGRPRFTGAAQASASGWVWPRGEARTLCPEGNNANLRSRPGLSQQLSQGRDRIGLARDAAHGDARSSEAPVTGACESGTKWVSSPSAAGGLGYEAGAAFALVGSASLSHEGWGRLRAEADAGRVKNAEQERKGGSVGAPPSFAM